MCLNWAESVRYSGWCWQRAQYDLLSKLSIVFFYFRYFPKLSSKFLCGILSLSTSCLIMEKSAMRFQNIFVGEPKYGCKIFLVQFGIEKGGRASLFISFLSCFKGVLVIYIAHFFMCSAGKWNVNAVDIEFSFDILWLVKTMFLAPWKLGGYRHDFSMVPCY